jgi:hypothetical protein
VKRTTRSCHSSSWAFVSAHKNGRASCRPICVDPDASSKLNCFRRRRIALAKSDGGNIACMGGKLWLWESRVVCQLGWDHPRICAGTAVREWPVDAGRRPRVLERNLESCRLEPLAFRVAFCSHHPGTFFCMTLLLILSGLLVRADLLGTRLRSVYRW